MMENRSLILNHEKIQLKIERIAHEIYENHFDEEQLHFFAIETRGVIFAKKLAEEVEKISGIKVNIHPIKINKKDPLKSQPQFNVTKEELKKKTIFLLDDVLNTGSTLMFAANFLIQFPIKGLRTVILVNRKHRLFPIRADFVGLSLATTLKEHISVDFSDKNNGVYLS